MEGQPTIEGRIPVGIGVLQKVSLKTFGGCQNIVVCSSSAVHSGLGGIVALKN